MKSMSFQEFNGIVSRSIGLIRIRWDSLLIYTSMVFIPVRFDPISFDPIRSISGWELHVGDHTRRKQESKFMYYIATDTLRRARQR